MKHSIAFSVLLIIVLTPVLVAEVQEPDRRLSGNMFPFFISFDAPDNATNVSGWLDAPAGKHGFIRVNDGHFVHDNGRVRFWGTNTCFVANFLPHELSDQIAERLARFGTNCVRLHNLDGESIWGGANAKSQLTMDPVAIDRLDYFVAALKSRGIYVNLGLHVSRTLDERDGFPHRDLHTKSDKGIGFFNRAIIEAKKKFAQDLLTHVNPYTKTAYKDEPAVAMIEISNENSIVYSWSLDRNFRNIKDPYLSEFRQEWNDWLQKKYGSDDALEKSWKVSRNPSRGTLEQKTIPIIWKDERSQHPEKALDDFCNFLLDLEQRFWREMDHFLKEEIGVRQPVSGSQLEFGGTMIQTTFDYCDIHGYWGHPTFPGQSWDGANWYVSNRAHVNTMNQPHTTLPRKALRRVAGRPFTVSEYGHPFPGQYGAEGLPLAAAFGAFQDWDGIFSFGYLHGSDIAPTAVRNYFMTAGDPVKTAHMIACFALFCRDTIQPAKTALVVPYNDEEERRIFRRFLEPTYFSLTQFGVDGRHALLSRTALHVDSPSPLLQIPQALPKEQEDFMPDCSTEAKEVSLHFHTPENGRGYCIANSEDVKLFTGFFDEGKIYPIGPMRVCFGKTNLGWVTFSATTVLPTKEGPRILLVATGEMKNTEMVLTRIEENRYTIKPGEWGKAPILCEGIDMTVEIPVEGKSVTCWALDESGAPRKQIPVVERDGQLVLHLKSEYKTLWYELRYSSLH